MNKKFIIYMILLTIIAFVPLTTYAMGPTNSNVYDGIDVSGWQGYINYGEVKASGIDIVYIKSSQGTDITDPYFRTNYTNAKANGLKIGFYHFLTATSVTDAINEANYFCSVISGTQPDCKLAMDFEVFNNLSNEEINNISFAFLQRVQELTNKEVVVYSDAYNATNVFSSALAERYPLWIAEYGVSEPVDTTNWSSWEGFQYTDTGEIAGISGYVDRDKFSSAILLDSSDTISTAPNTTNNIITYVVQPGNTLSQIALMYNTTVQEIAGLNSIPNPNLIFVGQVLKIDVTNGLDYITGNRYETNHIIYTIKPGDTLTSISQRFGVSINSIVRLNNISNPNLIFAGQTLRINLV